MNLIFNASAGTGKTWQVTGLYCDLVLGRDQPHLPPGRAPVDPERILLMTFTENAAAELRERVAKKMADAELRALEADDSAQADRARRVLRALPAAQISTIHAFCAGLIREHALELGLSPAFRTLDEDQRDLLLEESVHGEIFRALESDPELAAFCEGIAVLGESEYSLAGTIRSLIEKADSRGLDLSQAEQLLPAPRRTIGRRHFEKIRNELAAAQLPETAAKALDALNRFLAAFPDPELLEAVPKFGKAQKVKHLSEELAEIKERFLTEALYEEYAGRFQAFARLLAACSCAFAEAKRRLDSVDFGDQLLMARQLLLSDPVVNPEFDWIIVDEVQDTSRVQCDVIEALWRGSTRLVICGDRKQSIYAWRSADPGVMADLEQRMAERGGIKPVVLRQSFRSKERVLAAVNGLFSGVYGPVYEESALVPAEETGAALPGEGPCLEYLLPDSDAQGSEEEMAAVARRIRLLTGPAPQWRPRYGHDGTRFMPDVPVRYGDVLILLKRSTHLGVLEKALREAGIPFTSGGKGRALFDQQEVRDLLLFLQVLADPFNDLALAGFLRTPFAGVPDSQIVRLAQEGDSLDPAVLRRRFFEEGGAAAERIRRYSALSASMLPSQLVREMVRETAFDAWLAGQPGGEQKLANFKKALDWIRTAERGGPVLLPDLVRRFEKAIRTPPRSGSAEAFLPDPAQNAVTIMTVHGAKGLTKRVCFVPDISFGEPTDKTFAAFSPEGLLEMSLSGLKGGKVKTPGWDSARAADKEVREAEAKNVFYVAMTRARDLTVVSGAGTASQKGWLKLAASYLDGADAGSVRRVRFAELPESGSAAEGILADELPAVPVLKPLRIVSGLERKAVTDLTLYSGVAAAPEERTGRREVGTLGHAVLEELARCGWAGEIATLLRQTGIAVGNGEIAQLAGQLEAARGFLQRATAEAGALYPEHPFVLRRGDLILDGRIDLLVCFPGNRWKIFDYKFTGEAPEAARATYRPQLEACREAVGRLHPGAETAVSLLLIGEEIREVPL